MVQRRLRLAVLDENVVVPQRRSMSQARSLFAARPPSWKGIISLLLLTAVIAAAVGALIATLVVSGFTAHVPLLDQRLNIVMPPDLPVQVEVLQAGAPGAPPDASTGVPVRLNETLKLNVDFDTMVPLRMNVRYRGSIPVKTDIPINTQVRTRVLGVTMTLPIEGSIPLNLSLPVDLNIPIDQLVRLKFSAPLSGRINQIVHIPLRASLEARIRFADPLIPITVRQTELALPLRDLWLSGPTPLGGTPWKLGPMADPAPADKK
jgi:hypothetical protein